jgi:hypothetical protein
MSELEARIAGLDTSLLGTVPSETTDADRRSLLALHQACAQQHGAFEYLEIGSHLGGSLQALVRDPRCSRILSIDARPPEQPDARGRTYAYPGNSTERMLDHLRSLEGADLGKLATLDNSTERLDPANVRESIRPALCFIDGEHTAEACLRDARFCRQVIQDDGAIAFHDAWIVHRGLYAWLEELRAEGAIVRPYLLPDSVLVIEHGPARLLSTPQVEEMVRDGYWGYLWLAQRVGLPGD